MNNVVCSHCFLIFLKFRVLSLLLHMPKHWDFELKVCFYSWMKLRQLTSVFFGKELLQWHPNQHIS